MSGVDPLLALDRAVRAGDVRGGRSRAPARRRYRLHLGREHRTLRGDRALDEKETIDHMSSFTELLGQELGPTEWFEVDQERIELFARATDDPQWIHTSTRSGGRGPVRDDDRPRVPDARCASADDPDAWPHRLPDGDQLRRQQGAVPSAVPSGSRIRARFTVQSVEEVRAAIRASSSRRSSAKEATSRSASRARPGGDPLKRFEGKTALSRAAQGIGDRRATRAEGAHVVVADFDDGRERGRRQSGSAAVRCAATSRHVPTSRRRSPPLRRRAGLDLLVTCAGIIRDNLIHKLSDDDWEAVIATHLRGTFLAAQAAQAHMTAQQSGSMVLISSTSALGNRGQANYAAAKAGSRG